MVRAMFVMLMALAAGDACSANPVSALRFSACADAASAPALAGSLCARVAAPSTYDGSAATLELFVRKFPAVRSRGSVWLVAGGPGESGASLYALLPALRRSFPDADLLVPDHRGTGFSSRMCPQEESITSEGGMALAGAEWGSCFGRLIGQPALAAPFTLSNGARDLRFLIEQGDRGKPVWVYAVSYGTQLVLRALQIGPLPVRGVILDSLVPLQTDARFDLSQRAKLVDSTGRQLLQDCDADTACHGLLREPGEDVLKRVLVKGEANPALLAAIPGNNLKRFLGGALDVPAARALIPRLISELDADAAGDALPRMLAALREAGAALGDYPQSPPSIPLVSIISAAENNLRPELSAAVLKDEESALLFSSRLPELLVAPSLPIYRRDALFGGVPARLPPLLVLSGMRDPKTAYAGAQDHVGALRKAGPVRHIAVQGAPHFILWTAPDCLVASIRAFVAGARSGDASCSLAARFD